MNQPHPVSRSPFSKWRVDGYSVYNEHVPFVTRALQQVAIECAKRAPQISITLILRYGLNYEALIDFMGVSLMTYQQIGNTFDVSATTARGYGLRGEHRAMHLARKYYIPEMQTFNAYSVRYVA